MLDAILERNPAMRMIQSRAAGTLAGWGITANEATAAGLVIGIIAGLSFGAGWRDCGLVLIGVSAALDGVDGTIARQRGSLSPLGGVFDLCADRVVEIAVLIGLVWPHPNLYFPALVLAGSWYLNITAFLATGAAALTRATSGSPPEKLITYPPGLVERSEAILFLVVLAIAPGSGTILCYGYAALEVATATQRLAYAQGALAIPAAGK